MEGGLATAPSSAIPMARPRKAQDATVKAAGLMIVTPDNCALFLKRGEGDHEGEWCFPAGGIEGDEDPLTTAIRETREETGWTMPEDIDQPVKTDQREIEGVDFTTFRLDVNNPFIPTLDDEHTGWAWAPLDEPPEPTHPGVKATLAGDAVTDNTASRALLRNTIKYPPPKANDDERAIDLSFKRGGAGTTLKESPAARRYNTTTKDLAPGQISSSEMSRFRTMPARKQSEVISLLERIKKLKGRDPAKAAELQKQVDRLAGDDWKESDHPRGQPGNAGQFGPGGAGAKKDAEGAARGSPEATTAAGGGQRGTVTSSGSRRPSPPSDPYTAAKVFTEKYPNAEDPSKLSQEEVDERVSYADNIAKELAKKPTNEINTPERHALRKKLIDEIYSKDESSRKRDRDATIILGLPAAGKSTVANPIISEKGALEVDPDIAKGMLPEFANGLGAAATHEESSDITKEVLKRALANGDNIVWPRVDSPEKIIKDIKELKAMGYKVNLRHLEVTPELATQSAVGRFLKRGRYVPLSLIQEFGTQPLDAYKKAKQYADSSEAFERTDKGINKAPHL